ncbi:alpha-2-macroglobulin-like protein 1 [Leptodactylus fuscus]
MMFSGSKAQVCLNLLNTTETVNVIVVLEHNGKNTSIMAQDLEPNTYFQCREFEVPAVTEPVPVAIIFSAIGSATDLRERKTVVIKTQRPDSCMCQMDKPIYKPGEKMLFRFICLNSELKIVDQKFTEVYMEDQSRTRIAQWVDPKSEHGVYSFAFQLIIDAPAGNYIITGERQSGPPVRQWVTVEQYVPPRFKVDVDCPYSVSVTAESMKFNVSASYVYGEPLPGEVAIRYCKYPQYYGRRQNCFKDKEGSCADITGKLDKDGKYNGVIDLFSPFMRSSRSSSFNMDITITEEATGMQVTESRYVSITSQPARLSFDYEAMKPNYMRGIYYWVSARLTDESDQPMPNQEVEVQIDNGEPQTAITNSDGRIQHPIDTSNMVEANFTVRVSYTNPDQCYYAEWSEKDYPSIEFTVYRFYSYSGSFFDLKRPKGELGCDQTHHIDGDYIITPEGTGAKVDTVTVYYLVMSKSVIVYSGQKDISLSTARNGTFSLEIPVSFEMAPSAELVTYAFLKDEIVVDTLTLNIEKCFKNKVSMAFSKDKGPPGSKVEVQLKADPNSYCALRVIDSSLRLLNPYESFSADRIYNSRSFYTYGYKIEDFDVEDPAPACEDPDKLVFCGGRYYLPMSSSTEGDAYKKLKSLGLIMATTLRLRKPEVCDKNPPQAIAVPMLEAGSANFKASGLAMDSAGAGGGAGGATTTVRQNFAETMLFVIVPTDTEGRATESAIVPDTITTWEGTCFCNSAENGFGMTKYSANFTTMLQLFVEATLPYSFVRQEIMNLVVVVHSYLPKCVKVLVTLQESNAFTAVQKNEQQNPCVCGNGKLPFTWEVQAKVIGELNFTVSAQVTHTAETCDGPFEPSSDPISDAVMQTSISEADGVPKQLTQSNLVFLDRGGVDLPVSIAFPENMVPGSASAHVTVVGDFAALPLRHLQDLIPKPCGTGEQVLARVAPVPHIVNYLNATGRLDDQTYEKAKATMLAGYYRQSAFAYGDGYRMFPNPGETVNTFLNAFTFKTFADFEKHIFVDRKRQQQILISLENTQDLETGCFKNQGELYTAQDSDSDIFITAYTAAALSGSEYSLATTMLTGAMNCLKNAPKTEQRIQNQAVMYYVFALQNEHKDRDAMFEILMAKAKNEDGTLHWERDNMPKRPVGPYYWLPYPSPEVEMTSYMLLGMAATPDIDQERMNVIAQICMWLARQLGPNGNYRSTQDTVVGLQAMTTFAKLVENSTPSEQHVVVRRDNADVATMTSNQANRLLVQRASLPGTSGTYNIAVSGTGYCMIQTTMAYNVPVPKENSAFSLSMSTSPDDCINGVARKVTINVTVSYQGVRENSSLALFIIRSFSGYSADYPSLSKLKDNEVISRFDVTPTGQIVMYIKNLSKEPKKFSLNLFMGQRVMNVQTSNAVVSEYNDEDENGYASFPHPCAASSKASE